MRTIQKLMGFRHMGWRHTFDLIADRMFALFAAIYFMVRALWGKIFRRAEL
jgi:hypothetical protein